MFMLCVCVCVQLEVDGHLEVCSHVFNKRSAAWEPLIEPIENPVLNRFKRWALNMKASSHMIYPLSHTTCTHTRHTHTCTRHVFMESNDLP